MTNIRPKDAPAASTVQGGDTFLIDGATGVRALAVASVPVADANGNAAINRVTEGYATTATAAGTTVLTVASARMQYFTGITTQIVTLPVVTTLPALGFSFSFQNNSTGVVTINSSGGNAVLVLPPGGAATVTCILLTGTTAASWSSSSTVTPWTTYTPTITSGSGTFTTVSATGRYKQIGKVIHLQVDIVITTAGTAGSSLIASLPASAFAATAYTGIGRERVATGVSAIAYITTADAAHVNIQPVAGGTIIASGNSVTASITYEAA